MNAMCVRNLEESDKNLLIVTAVEGYSKDHGFSEAETFDFFQKNGILDLVRNQYEALHTQPLEETVRFVEDYINFHKLPIGK